jgi:hypothetical protein
MEEADVDDDVLIGFDYDDNRYSSSSIFDPSMYLSGMWEGKETSPVEILVRS